MNIQDRTAIPGDEQGVHNHAERRSVYNLGICQVTGCQSSRVGVDAPRSDIEGVIVGRNLMEPCIVELCAPPAQAVSGAAVNVLIGSEQEHDRKEGRRVPALAVAQVDFHALHALPVALILPEHTGEIPDQRFQAGHQALVMGKHLPDHLCIAHNARLNALGHPGAAAGGAAKFLDILGAKFAVHICRCVFESVDIHGYLLVKMKKPGKWIVRRVVCIQFYRSWLRWRFFCHASSSLMMVFSICRGV